MALTPPVLPATYSGDPLNSPTDEVRFLVGDTDPDSLYLSDAEINYCLVLVYGANGTVPATGNYLPAAYAADGIIAKLKFLVDESVGDLHVSYSKTQGQFQQVANRMRSRAAIAGVAVFAGGLSLAAKIGQYANKDLLGTATRVDGMDDADTMNTGAGVSNNGGNGTGF